MLTKPAVAVHQIDHIPTLLVLASMYIDLGVSLGLAVIDLHHEVGRRITIDYLYGLQGLCDLRIVELLMKGAMHQEVDIPVRRLCWIRDRSSYTCKEPL